MKALPLIALAACLAVAGCRSAPTQEPATPGEAQAASDSGSRLEDPESVAAAAAQDLQQGTSPVAAEVAAQPERSGWQIAIEPYVFFAGASGSVSPAGPGNDLDASFRDLLDELDVGAMVALEVGHSDSSWKALVDLLYLDLEEDGTSPTGDAASAELDPFVGELDAALELQPDGLVDLIFGARWWSVSVDVSVDQPPPAGTVSADGSESWVDPVIGLRSRLPLSSSFDIVLRGDVAGFGLGSEFSSHLYARLDWILSRSIQLGAGIRQFYVDYAEDGLAYDVKFGGPFIGLTWRL